jgi:hypothetical protein
MRSKSLSLVETTSEPIPDEKLQRRVRYPFVASRYRLGYHDRSRVLTTIVGRRAARALVVAHSAAMELPPGAPCLGPQRGRLRSRAVDSPVALIRRLRRQVRDDGQGDRAARERGRLCRGALLHPRRRPVHRHARDCRSRRLHPLPRGARASGRGGASPPLPATASRPRRGLDLRQSPGARSHASRSGSASRRWRGLPCRTWPECSPCRRS